MTYLNENYFESASLVEKGNNGWDIDRFVYDGTLLEKIQRGFLNNSYMSIPLHCTARGNKKEKHLFFI